jgi:hypothetical protein
MLVLCSFLFALHLYSEAGKGVCEAFCEVSWRFVLLQTRGELTSVGHADGIFSLGKHPTRLSILLSGACDGEVRMWDLSTSECLYNQIHHKYVRVYAPR